MSYSLDLDEYDETKLERELRERSEKRARGLCDYCNRHPSTSACKFPHRHNDPRIHRVDDPSL